MKIFFLWSMCWICSEVCEDILICYQWWGLLVQTLVYSIPSMLDYVIVYRIWDQNMCEVILFGQNSSKVFSDFCSHNSQKISSNMFFFKFNGMSQRWSEIPCVKSFKHYLLTLTNHKTDVSHAQQNHEISIAHISKTCKSSQTNR